MNNFIATKGTSRTSVSTFEMYHFLDVSDAPNIPSYPAVASASGGPTTTVTSGHPPGSDQSLLADADALSLVFLVLNLGQRPIPLLPPPAPAPLFFPQLQCHRDSDAPAAQRLPSRMRPP